jgi:hypothetical protein
MKIINEKAEIVSTNKLVPHPKNPRQGDVGTIIESIKENGWYGTIVAQQGTNFILAGNHRWQAAEQLGMSEVPVTWVDVDDETALRILLADNRTSDLASHDDNVLVDLLNDLSASTTGLAGTGWDEDALDNLLTMLEPNALKIDDENAIDNLQEYLNTVKIVLQISAELAKRFHAIQGKDDSERLARLLDGG